MRTALVTLNATEDPRGGAGGLAGVRVSRAGIDVPASRVSVGSVRAGLDGVKIPASYGTKSRVHTPRSKHEGEELEGGLES